MHNYEGLHNRLNASSPSINRCVNRYFVPGYHHICSSHPRVENVAGSKQSFPLARDRFRLDRSHISEIDLFINRLCRTWRKSIGFPPCSYRLFNELTYRIETLNKDTIYAKPSNMWLIPFGYSPLIAKPPRPLAHPALFHQHHHLERLFAVVAFTIIVLCIIRAANSYGIATKKKYLNIALS